MILVKGIGISSGREMGTVHKLVSIDFKPINKHIDAVSVEDEKKRIEEPWQPRYILKLMHYFC